MRRTRTALLAAALALTTGVAFAQMQHGGMQHGPGHGVAGAKSADSPSTQAYKAAAAKMHKDMAIPYTGESDVDFVRGMIPHHQAAIDMAKIQLEYGKDPEIRKLAQEVIAAQEAEITQMKAWLKAKGQ